ncbi:MAG: NAD(P)-binding domain-containing protein [Stomatobaculum sp.]|nr:NAD(P)-binding domain-containing protein [Stomatobaculum sp.]
MALTAAVLGAGRMGSVAAEQLPGDVRKLIVDMDEAAAKRIAEKTGGEAHTDYESLSLADVVFLVLPATVIPKAAEEAASHMKTGAVLVNMSTKGEFPEDLAARYPSLSIVCAKIIGHADSMREGAPSLVVTDTEDEKVLELLRYLLPGYAGVVQGDVTLVPKLSTIASTEGIRAAVRVKKQAEALGIPEGWFRPLIYTVCAGTARAFIDGNMGEFARQLAEQFAKEE